MYFHLQVSGRLTARASVPQEVSAVVAGGEPQLHTHLTPVHHPPGRTRHPTHARQKAQHAEEARVPEVALPQLLHSAFTMWHD